MVGILSGASARRLVLGLGALGLVATLGANRWAAAQDLVPPPAPDAEAADPNVEVLTRGPVHEAYATPLAEGRAPGLIVPNKPADPIEEAPPDVKPEGEDAIWIPGYWSWDDERKDFLWVSGVWRVPPPDYRWVPGYWQEAQGGWQWVSGFWMASAAEDVEYLPQPPETVEQGPSSPAPGENHFWVPGCWRWQETRYVWGPGYWAAVQPEWIWVSPTYYWTPRGWVYCAGYWDYPLARRGLLFSPVYFVRPVRFYRPAVCVDVGILTFSLFARPNYCHYYFGDYYAPSYVQLGIRPWFHYHHHDPLYNYYRWHHRHQLHDVHWEKNLRGWHDYYRDHPKMRPPHTLVAQQKLLSDKSARARPDFQKLAIAQSSHKLKDDPKAFVRVRSVDKAQQTVLQQSVKQELGMRNERRQLESKALAGKPGAAAGKMPPLTKPEKVSLKRLPDFQATQLPGKTPKTPGRFSPERLGSAKPDSGKLRPDKIVSPKTTPSHVTPGKLPGAAKVDKGDAGKVTPEKRIPGKLTQEKNTPDKVISKQPPREKVNIDRVKPPKTTVEPKIQPSVQPKIQPSVQPKIQPSVQPKIQPSVQPKIQPSVQPKIQPSVQPKIRPSVQPKIQPSIEPRVRPVSPGRGSTQPLDLPKASGAGRKISSDPVFRSPRSISPASPTMRSNDARPSRVERSEPRGNRDRGSDRTGKSRD